MSDDSQVGNAPNGKVILLYRASEEPHIGVAKEVLKECGIIAIACGDPNNFRFVVPEVVVSTNVDLVGRLALQALGTEKPLSTFALSIRDALAPKPPAVQQARK